MKTLLNTLILTIFTINGFAQDNKEGARSFFTSVVKTYFDKDCDKFYSFFGDSVTIISPAGTGIYSTKGMDEGRKACDKFGQFTEGLNSLQQYLEDYKIIVLDRSEFTAGNNDSILKAISAEQTGNGFVYEILQEQDILYTDCDFLVFGNIHQSDSNKNLSHGLFWMIVRKTKNGWRIFGTKA